MAESEKLEVRQEIVVRVICIVLCVGLVIGIGYEYYAYVAAHENSQPVLFKNEVARTLNEANTPILFIGQYRGDISQYLNESSAYDMFDKAIGITYVTAGPTVLDENLYVTYWRLIKNEKGIVKASRLATVEYKKDFYFIQGVTAEGIFFKKMRFSETDLFFASALVGLVIGLFVPLLVSSRIRKRREIVA